MMAHSYLDKCSYQCEYIISYSIAFRKYVLLSYHGVPSTQAGYHLNSLIGLVPILNASGGSTHK